MADLEVSSPRLVESAEFGAIFQEDGRVRFRFWAPALHHVNLVIEGRSPLPMDRLDEGWFEITTNCEANAAYRYQIAKDLMVPDPAARAMLGDALGSSLVYDTRAYRWRTEGWKGRPWREALFYELHVGAFGGFTGVIEALPRLADLGVTAIELMPLSAFPGERNWGYDGVLPYAPSSSYGSPDELKALIDTAHELGLMVFLDVVYNHFGPEGNFISVYAPSFFRPDLHNAWGRAIDFSRSEVRRFYTENGLYWLQEFRFDGLRFDAVHAITHPDWLDQTAAEFQRALPSDRYAHFVLENDDNGASHLRGGCFAAQWNDDAHHVLHLLLTGETGGYYVDYAENPAAKLARALAEGFIYQGQASANRGGAPRGTPSDDLKPECFVFFLQNHDQIGNRAWGERLTELTEPMALEAAIALQLLTPHIPLIFMGEEDASKNPFLFFCEMNEKLAHSIREGRRREFKLEADELPDPTSAETFERSVPQPDPRLGERRFRYYQRRLALRRDRIAPYISDAQSLGAHAISEKAVIARWRLGNGADLTVAINLGAEATPCLAPTDPLLFESVDGAYEMLSEGTLAAKATVVLLSHFEQ
jgi:maltooligosyltrehalose trehalohydrolase